MYKIKTKIRVRLYKIERSIKATNKCTAWVGEVHYRID